MKKQKTRKDLEGAYELSQTELLCAGIIAFVLFLGFCIVNIQKSDLEIQLSDCQEQVPVWTLKFVCVDIDAFSKITFEQNFTDYNDYEAGLSLVGDKKYKLFENCEVIE